MRSRNRAILLLLLPLGAGLLLLNESDRKPQSNFASRVVEPGNRNSVVTRAADKVKRSAPSAPATPAALDELVSLELSDVPLPEALAAIEKQLGVRFHVEPYVDRNSPNSDVTIHVAGVSGHAVLDMLLQPFNWDWNIRDGAVWVADRSIIAEQSAVKLYDVSDLVIEPGSKTATPEFSLLIDTLSSSIPLSESGGNKRPTIEPVRTNGKFALAITETRLNHERIASLLTQLREAPPHLAVAVAKQTLPADPARTREAAILAAVDKTVTLNIANGTVDDGIEILKRELSIQIVLDPKTESWQRRLPITIHLSGVSCRAALDILLPQLGFDWDIRHEVLWIGNGDEIAGAEEIRVYDVAELVLQPGDASGAADFDSLAILIPSLIAPQTWRPGTGPGDVAPLIAGGRFVVVIPQSRRVHEEIAKLLAELRAVPFAPQGLPARVSGGAPVVNFGSKSATAVQPPAKP